MPPKLAPEAPKPTLNIFGNYFFPETRTIICLLDLNAIPYNFQHMEMFTKEGRADYQSINPADQLTTIIEGLKTIIGDP
jgi:hypothetical protein